MLSLSLVVALLATAPGCAAGLTATQRAHCRQLRSQTAGRAIGGLIGSVVLLGVIVVASAATGSSPNFGNLGRRRGRGNSHRAARLAACRDQVRANRHAAAREASVDTEGELVADIPIVPAQEGPPSVLELDEIIAERSAAIGACAPQARGELLVDARIQGASGAVSGVALSGSGSRGVSVACVMRALAPVRTRTFNGAVDVRWSVDMKRASAAPAASGGPG